MLLRLSLLLTAPRLHRLPRASRNQLPRASRNQPVTRKNLRPHRTSGSPRPGRTGELNSAGDLAPCIPRWELGRPLPGCPKGGVYQLSRVIPLTRRRPHPGGTRCRPQARTRTGARARIQLLPRVTGLLKAATLQVAAFPEEARAVAEAGTAVAGAGGTATGAGGGTGGRTASGAAGGGRV